ncbi:PAAR domain-containing protein [Chromobacterium haemolyticum]|uniref:PAAR domain-containing protein n=1 Tax=Chromobacterium fluminis TaxID=3044269 RepID=A0ABX0LET1_9NEIS|nr:PAAR domain-containing protein [Chromobacterium haemolyticum]NHR08022.1 PAAR domain-containing protein [Chromobacterium haemolyticum]
MKRVIRLGDPTDHGGVVTSATSSTVLFDKPVALLGDAVSCPRQGHTNCTIVECDPSWTVNGKGVALEGHMVSCGARLISTMPEVGRSYESSASASPALGAGMALAASGAALLQMFNEKFQVLDESSGLPLANHQYAIVRADGKVEHGVTDDEGHTHLTKATVESEELSIFLEG